MLIVQFVLQFTLQKIMEGENHTKYENCEKGVKCKPGVKCKTGVKLKKMLILQFVWRRKSIKI